MYTKKLLLERFQTLTLSCLLRSLKNNVGTKNKRRQPETGIVGLATYTHTVDGTSKDTWIGW